MSKVSSTPQTGVLIYGAGAVRNQALMANLATLTLDQQDLVNRAKKYAIEQSVKSILSKQAAPQPQIQQKSLQKHQALVLMCRVYVGSISFEVREETVNAAFSLFGAVKCINMTIDPITAKHKGFAFVEYELPEAAHLALEHMNGIQLGNRQIRVGRPSNIPQAAPIIQQIQADSTKGTRIYVSNVHPDLSEPDLVEIFESFGKIVSCKLAMTPDVETPQHRGYGFIEFDSDPAAGEALTMDNFNLGGQTIHVCRATTPPENLSIYGTLDSDSAQLLGSSNEASVENNSSDQGDKSRERIHNSSTEIISDPVEKVSSMSTKEASGNSTEDSKQMNIIVLRHMVGSDEEVDDSLHLDVYEECVKHGPLTQLVIYVDRGATGQADEIKIFIKYKEAASSQRARQALDGRFFAGRKISAEHYDWLKFRLGDLTG